jgi:poly-beta-1,6-N-acetyl-D-glucosamine synthase
MTLSYVLITPARNEEANIGRTIEAVSAQTLLPKKWIIVSDGSTDHTDAVIQEYRQRYPWIDYMRMPERADRSFAAKVRCFNAAYERLAGTDFDIIGNLDADISFDNDYFEFLVDKFAADTKLGVAGTPFIEEGKAYDYRFTNIEHVSGACQIFRSECFSQIGGYVPIKEGGIDWVAVTTARMMGWKTRTFVERTCIHHRRMGSANSRALMIWLKQGRKDYFLGNHPLWEVFRGFYQMKRRPVIVGGLLLWIGFLGEALNGKKRPISTNLMDFVRREQLQRLRGALLLRWIRK